MILIIFLKLYLFNFNISFYVWNIVFKMIICSNIKVGVND